MNTPNTWSCPPAALDLRNDNVHLWRAFLDVVPETLRPEEKLSLGDLALASHFVFARDRDRFVAGRMILREILGKYLGRPSAEITFIYGPQRKPQVSLNDSDPPIRFNISHSAGLAVYAIVLNREIGVDIEAIRDDLPTQEITDRFFSDREISEFRSLPVHKRNEAFFLCWTRKEAYLKALGSGLSVPLDSFDVSLTPGNPACLHSHDATRWTLRCFQPQKAYAGAVVAEGNHLKLDLWDYPRTMPLPDVGN
jgi:4'-phosphopantetheinyl transferase